MTLRRTAVSESVLVKKQSFLWVASTICIDMLSCFTQAGAFVQKIECVLALVITKHPCSERNESRLIRVFTVSASSLCRVVDRQRTLIILLVFALCGRLAEVFPIGSSIHSIRSLRKFFPRPLRPVKYLCKLCVTK
jgi:hypothetical protein